MMRQHAFASDRAKRTTPASHSSLSRARIGVRGFDDSVLVLSTRLVGRMNVSIACGALKS
jgi:hypothetical protein